MLKQTHYTPHREPSKTHRDKQTSFEPCEKEKNDLLRKNNTGAQASENAFWRL
jgi:hypothetical protein